MRGFRCVSLVLCGGSVACGSASSAGDKPATASACVEKSGSATGITRDFAEYEALLIIRQVTGNWPVQSDRITEVKSSCTQGSVLWTCVTRAKVCRE